MSFEQNVLVRDVVYEANVINEVDSKNYVGDIEGEWKRRFYNHKMTLNNIKCKGINRSYYPYLGLSTYY